MAKQAVATQQDAPPALLANYLIASPEALEANVGEILRDAFGPAGPNRFDLYHLKVPAGTSPGVWQLHDFDTGEVDTPKTVEGVILQIQDVRAYWDKPFTGGGVPPTCSSNDGVVGQGDPGGNCAICPLAQFGTAKDQAGQASRGQACKQRKLVYFLMSDSIIPRIVSVPPTSLQSIREFTLWVAGKMMRPYQVKVAMTLDGPETTPDGQKYWRIVPKRVGGPDAVISGDELALVRSMAESITPVVDVSAVYDDGGPPYEG